MQDRSRSAERPAASCSGRSCCACSSKGLVAAVLGLHDSHLSFSLDLPAARRLFKPWTRPGTARPLLPERRSWPGCWAGRAARGAAQAVVVPSGCILAHTGACSRGSLCLGTSAAKDREARLWQAVQASLLGRHRPAQLHPCWPAGQDGPHARTTQRHQAVCSEGPLCSRGQAVCLQLKPYLGGALHGSCTPNLASLDPVLLHAGTLARCKR